MLDNAENNAVAMQELESELAECEMGVMVNFDHLKHRVRCYAHIINICCSHIIALVTSVSKQYLSKLKVPVIQTTCFAMTPWMTLDDDDGMDSDCNIGELELDDLPTMLTITEPPRMDLQVSNVILSGVLAE
jgi:hypothetical protein